MASLFKSIPDYLEKQLQLDPAQKNIISFGLEVLYSGLLSIGLTLLLAYLFGVFREVFWLMLFSAAPKGFAGGAHCSSPGRCAFLTATSFIFLGKLALYGSKEHLQLLSALIPAAIIVTLLATYFWAPFITPEKPFSQNYQKKLRKNSLMVSFFTCAVLLLMYCFQANPSILWAGSLGLLWFAFAISPVGCQIIAFIDRFLVKIF
ncbi:MAG: accessory gene regulator ArgB-like protein [Bacillota bacterium]|jgi:accessory gene regulator B